MLSLDLKPVDHALPITCDSSDGPRAFFLQLPLPPEPNEVVSPHDVATVSESAARHLRTDYNLE